MQSIYPDIKKTIISFTSNKIELAVTDEYDLIPIVTPEEASIKIYSDNEDIIIVEDDGHLLAINEGSTTITEIISYNDERFIKEYTITVSPQNYNNFGSNAENNEQKASDLDRTSNNFLQESETNNISIKDITWLDSEKIYNDECATTMIGEEWSDCIRFGSSNINSDGTSVLRAVCDKYNRFTAEFAPQEGFDKSETVTLYVYGANDEGQTFKEEYQIDYSTKNIMVDVDISNSDELYIWKAGDYNQGRIAGQFINGYTGMGVLMRDATLYE